MREGKVMTAGARPIHPAKGDAIIAAALAAARDYLDMAVAYLSEFDGDEVVPAMSTRQLEVRPYRVGKGSRPTPAIAGMFSKQGCPRSSPVPRR